jgi:hypothetical protein
MTLPPDSATSSAAAPAPEPDVRGDATSPQVHRLHPHVLRIRFWKAFAFGAAVMMAGVAAVLVKGHTWAVLPVVAGAVILVIGLTAYARAYAARFGVQLLDDGLLVRRGVAWRSEVFIPRARVQHTDVAQGPLDRQFGVATLKIFTAGSHLGVTEVEGLSHASAVGLRDGLLGRQGSDGV